MAEPFGLPPDKMNGLVGKRVKRNIAYDDTILEEHLINTEKENGVKQ